MRKVYLDYAATTPLDPQVLEAMLPYLKEKFGNPSSLHSFGQEARAAVDRAREQVSQFLNCQPQEIIFTGTTTEADNLAIVGVAKAVLAKGNHLVTSPIEHHGALDVFKSLEKNGFEITYLLFGIFILLAGILAAILSYPGPKKSSPIRGENTITPRET